MFQHILASVHDVMLHRRWDRYGRARPNVDILIAEQHLAMAAAKIDDFLRMTFRVYRGTAGRKIDRLFQGKDVAAGQVRIAKDRPHEAIIFVLHWQSRQRCRTHECAHCFSILSHKSTVVVDNRESPSQAM
jgi:hypothetical protein